MVLSGVSRRSKGASSAMTKAVGPRGGEHANEAQMKMRSIWRTKAWRERRRELIRLHPKCEWCRNNPSQQISHKRDGYYPGYELCKRDEVDVICQKCHDLWTKKRIKVSASTRECTACNYPVYGNKTRCFNCDAVVKINVAISPKMAVTYSEILRSCPEVVNGDVWWNLAYWPKEEVTVTGWKEQDAVPWPLIITSRGEVGLPAFKFGELRTRGQGPGWR